MKTLKLKIFLTVFLLQAVFFATAIYFYYSYQTDKSMTAYRAEKENVVKVLIGESQHALQTKGFDAVSLKIKQLVEANEIQNAVLFNHNDAVVAGSLSETENYSNDMERGWQHFPFEDKSGVTGALKLQYSTAAMNKISSEVLATSGWLSLAGLFLCALTAYLAASLLTLRFNRIVNTADQVAEGVYRSRTEEYGKDDLARLGMAFDSILAHIESERKHSREYEKELEDRVSTRTHELEIANEENRAFAISVTQDLRDPLRRLKSYAQVLQEDYRNKLDGEGQAVIDRIQFNCRELSRLIDSLLQLTRVGHQELNRRNVNLSSLIKDVVKKIAAQYPQHTVHTKIQPDLMVYADGILLRRVIENLVENAWKFTRHARHPILDVGVKFDNHPIYYFKDNGVGFDPDYEDRLFVPFQRLHQDKEFHGVGIGLSTTQHIIHRHGGEIWAEGEAGEGATFFFTLPDEKSAAADAA